MQHPLYYIYVSSNYIYCIRAKRTFPRSLSRARLTGSHSVHRLPPNLQIRTDYQMYTHGSANEHSSNISKRHELTFCRRQFLALARIAGCSSTSRKMPSSLAHTKQFSPDMASQAHSFSLSPFPLFFPFFSFSLYLAPSR